jgi:hypothetical protein
MLKSSQYTFPELPVFVAVMVRVPPEFDAAVTLISVHPLVPVVVVCADPAVSVPVPPLMKAETV